MAHQFLHEANRETKRTRLPWIVVAVAALLAIAFDVLVDQVGPNILGAAFGGLTTLGINIPIMTALVLLAAVGLTRYLDAYPTWKFWVAAAFAMAFSIPFALISSPLALAVCFWSRAVSILYVLFELLCVEADFDHPFQAISRGMGTVIGRISNSPLKFANKVWTWLRGAERDRARKILIGIAAAVPVLIVFLALFYSADPLFQKALKDLLTFDLQERLLRAIGHIALFILVAGILTRVFGSAFLASHNDAKNAVSPKRYSIETTIVFSLTALLFAVFLAFQWKYLFGGEAVFSGLDMTFAEYARRGYGELIVAAGLVLLMFTSARYFHREKPHPVLMAAHLILLLETLLVLASAMMRLKLYIGEFGYTPDRLFAAISLTAIGVIIVLAMNHLAVGAPLRLFFPQSLVVFGVAMLAFAYISPDALSMKLNIEKARAGGRAVAVSDVFDAWAEGLVVFRTELANPFPTSNDQGWDLVGKCRSFASGLDVYAKQESWSNVNLARRNLLSDTEPIRAWIRTQVVPADAEAGSACQI